MVQATRVTLLVLIMIGLILVAESRLLRGSQASQLSAGEEVKRKSCHDYTTCSDCATGSGENFLFGTHKCMWNIIKYGHQKYKGNQCYEYDEKELNAASLIWVNDPERCPRAGQTQPRAPWPVINIATAPAAQRPAERVENKENKESKAEEEIKQPEHKGSPPSMPAPAVLPFECTKDEHSVPQEMYDEWNGMSVSELRELVRARYPSENPSRFIDKHEFVVFLCENYLRALFPELFAEGKEAKEEKKEEKKSDSAAAAADQDEVKAEEQRQERAKNLQRRLQLGDAVIAKYDEPIGQRSDSYLVDLINIANSDYPELQLPTDPRPTLAQFTKAWKNARLRFHVDKVDEALKEGYAGAERESLHNRIKRSFELVRDSLESYPKIP